MNYIASLPLHCITTMRSTDSQRFITQPRKLAVNNYRVVSCKDDHRTKREGKISGEKGQFQLGLTNDVGEMGERRIQLRKKGEKSP